MTDNPFALFWAWTDPVSSPAGHQAALPDNERLIAVGAGAGEPETPRPTLRRHKAAGCTYCEREGSNTFHPPHDASRYCQSGGHAHCSCDTCF